jgi:hypothetical protein
MRAQLSCCEHKCTMCYDLCPLTDKAIWLEFGVREHERPTPGEAAGVGEMPATLIAPAMANAFARLTGKRLRSLPMSPEQVMQALHA